MPAEDRLAPLFESTRSAGLPRLTAIQPAKNVTRTETPIQSPPHTCAEMFVTSASRTASESRPGRSSTSLLISRIAYRHDVTATTRIKDVILSTLSVRRMLEAVLLATGAGDKLAYWDGMDNYGGKVASGVYFARLNVDGLTAFGKLVVLK